VGIALLAALAGVPLALDRLERRMIETGPNGPETPGGLGLAFERLKIPSGNRLLDGYLVESAPACPRHAALLIFHGVGETISQWVNVQRLLYDSCIASVVFDYSGNGDSSRPGTVRNLHQDAIAAYSAIQAHFGAAGGVCTLGFSMGNAVLLDAYTEFHPQPRCMILGAAFSSGRDSAVSGWGIPRWMAHLLPDQWNNVAAISRSHPPLLVIHSDADLVNPLWMGQSIYQAAPEPKQLVILHGLRHNAAYRGPIEEWWGPVIEFIAKTETVP